jgi:hypothetical protein
VSGLIRYPEERAIENAAFAHGLTPTRLGRLLLPVWQVEVQATIYDSEPYDLIDRYLELAIARGGLASDQELAEFYGLDAAVTGNAARFLESIGHLSRDRAGRLVLSDLGLRSVQEGKRYTRALEDRRHLYFDGFACRPLTRPFYDERSVTVLGPARLPEALAETGRDAFTPVIRFPEPNFSPQALTALAQWPAAERNRFNLPEQVVSPTVVTSETVYLPAYLVRAVDQVGAVRFLAYTQASQEADPEWSQVCAAAVEVATLIENEYQSGRNEGETNAARRWVERRFTGRFGVEWRDGTLVATLPAAAFAGGDSLEPRRIGSFIRMDNWYFRLWCDDQGLRRRALLDLADAYLSASPKITADQAVGRLDRFCRQVALGPMPAAEIAQLARKSGRKSLAAQLDKLG